MPDREKAIRGLECCIIGDPDGSRECKKCPYRRKGITNEPCFNALHVDAIYLLKEQEARVLTLEEIRSGAFEVVWLEDADKPNAIPGIWFRLSNEGEDEAVDIHVLDGFVGARLAVYGKMWRAWTSRPSLEQMEETPWEEAGRETRNTVGDGKQTGKDTDPHLPKHERGPGDRAGGLMQV